MYKPEEWSNAKENQLIYMFCQNIIISKTWCDFWWFVNWYKDLLTDIEGVELNQILSN